MVKGSCRVNMAVSLHEQVKYKETISSKFDMNAHSYEKTTPHTHENLVRTKRSTRNTNDTKRSNDKVVNNLTYTSFLNKLY